MSANTETPKPPHANEAIKSNSRNLRGTIAEGLKDQSTGGISADDSQLTKFHGLYLQDDRDLRKERRQQKLERAFSFMIRVRVSGGICSPEQYTVIDELSDLYGNGTIRLTTRQAFQMHGILKGNLRPLIQGMDQALMNSIGACGDINRNVMCHVHPERSAVHREVYSVAESVANHLLPRSRAYHEIWLEDELVGGGEVEEEPIYGTTYLPRKFKIGVAIPPSNDVDVYSQDLGLIAVIDEGKLQGFNLVIGGGLGMSHGNAKTYPKLAQSIGFCLPDQVNALAEAIVTTQRDHGDRSDRRHARLKYTLEDMGLDVFKKEVKRRSGIDLGEERPFRFERIADDYGWNQGSDGLWSYVHFIQSGRIAGTAKRALREMADLGAGDFRLTPSQNIAICGLDETQRQQIMAILVSHGLDHNNHRTGLRLNSMACPALPTCGMALAESERQLPEFLDTLETVLVDLGLEDEPISIRSTGCPNGCARPYLAEIGIVGKAPGKYNLFLGADYLGRRLNTEVVAAQTPEQILERLSALLKQFAGERNPDERFGDFCHRIGAVGGEG